MNTETESVKIKPFKWESRLRQIVLVIVRLGLAYLFFSQLFWKLPPRFGCGPGPGFEFTSVSPSGELSRTSGLCDWIGIESIYSQRNALYLSIPDQYGTPRFWLNLSPLVKLNGLFVDQFVRPNFGWFGWLIFLAEAFVAVSLFLGVFSRAGGLVSLFLSMQLLLGVGGIWDPAAHLQEWEWGYHLMILLSLVMLATAPGRFLGLDARLRPRLAVTAGKGSRLARLLLAFT